MADNSPIHFYSTTEDYGEFSNFASFPIEISRKTWPTVEHYFQAQKFTDKSHQTKIRKAKSPMEAARLGRSRKVKIRRDWDNARLTVMRIAVTQKFIQHSNLKELLLSTNDRKLVEHTANDSFWGDGGDGTGENQLGRILMAVRSELRELE